MTRSLPAHADVVVVGGGVLGASAAFHLRELGREVLLLDRGPVGAEASSQGAGFLCSIRPKQSSAQIVRYSTEFYSRFHERTGYDIDLHPTGGIRVALGDEWFATLRGEAATGRSIGVETDELSPADLAEGLPAFDLRGAVGGTFTPFEGYITWTRDAAVGLARGAARRGGDIRTGEEVSGVEPVAGSGFDVVATSGRVRAATVVLAANAWLWPLLRDLAIPLCAYPIHHQLGVYDIPAGILPTMPTVRIGERDLYLRHEAGGLMVGGVGSDPPSPATDDAAEAFGLAAVRTHGHVYEAMLRRAIPFVPALDGAICIREQRGLLMVAPDLEPLLGELLPGLFVMTADLRGIQSGPGLGKLVAELIATGEPEWDPTPYRPDRFAELARDPEAVRLAATNALRPALYSVAPA
jgi:4-methylaminobutanoate oxidase (formaldehyde-forming)